MVTVVKTILALIGAIFLFAITYGHGHALLAIINNITHPTVVETEYYGQRW